MFSCEFGEISKNIFFTEHVLKVSYVVSYLKERRKHYKKGIIWYYIFEYLVSRTVFYHKNFIMRKMFQWQDKFICKFDYEISRVANEITKFQEQ